MQPVIRRTVRSGLRSENSQNYYVPRVRTKLGERAFSYAGPVVWNNLYLHVYIRAEPDTRFKNILKTYFFTLAFDLLGSILAHLLGFIVIIVINFTVARFYVFFCNSGIGLVAYKCDMMMMMICIPLLFSRPTLISSLSLNHQVMTHFFLFLCT